MIILDTNVVSALMRETSDPSVVAWLDRQPRTSIWTTSITVFEVWYGLQIMSAGKKRSQLTAAFKIFLDKIGRQIAPFDGPAAEHAGDLMAVRHKKGRPGDLRDSMIAGIVIANNATLATGNTTHFEDLHVTLINPWNF